MPAEGIFDIHCHIIPSVDDGAADIREAEELLRMEYRQGVRSIILTPHFRIGMFETPQEQIKKQFLILKEIAGNISHDLKLYLGCEFHVNMEMLEMLKNGQGTTMAGSRYILTEFSHMAPASYIRERLYSLLLHGYKPVTAHVERYDAVRRHIGFVDEIIDMGALIQVNADSIIGAEGFSAKRFCHKLLKNQMVHFVGSDCHGTARRVPKIGIAYNYILKKFGKNYADKIFAVNPRCILENDFIEL